jgi:hypothetical protein
MLFLLMFGCNNNVNIGDYVIDKGVATPQILVVKNITREDRLERSVLLS